MGLDIYINRISSKEVGYFRKVNFLVAFFEKKGLNVPDQGVITIYKEDAEELLNLCNLVLNDRSKAPKLLPTMDGFFFGDTKYDDIYFKNVEDVREYIKERLLPMYDNLIDDEYIQFEINY